MRPPKTAWLHVVLLVPVCWAASVCALDLSVINIPPFPSATVTPQIDNVATLKKFHLRDLETAEDLQVSCFVGASQNCVVVSDGTDFLHIPGPLPSSVEVEFSLINSSNEVIRSVTDTYNVTWNFDPLNPTCMGVGTVQSSYAQIPSTNLPLSGLELPVDTYRVQARVDPNDLLEETDETNNTRNSDDSFTYAIYSGDLIYGPITTQLTELVKMGVCLAGTTAVSAGSVADWDHDWGTTEFNPTPGCYNFATDADGYSLDLMAHAGINPVGIGTLTGPTPSGVDACLISVTLDENGAHYGGASVKLPEDVSIHELEDESNVFIGPAPRGIGEVFFPDGGDFTEILEIADTFRRDGFHFYHAYGLPFTLSCATSEFVIANSEPLQIQQVVALHNHFGRYASCNAQDPRAAQHDGTAFPLNDIYYMGFDFSNPDGVIDADGIQMSQLGFGGTPAALLQQPRTSYPQGRLFFGPDDVQIVDSEIIQEEVPIDRFELRMRRRCPDDNCGDLAAGRTYVAEIVDGSAFRTDDGALSAPFEMLSQQTDWGKFEGVNATYRRDDSVLPGIFTLPGYYCPGTVDESNRTVSQILLGSRLYDGPNNRPNTLSPLREGGPSADSNRGNGFYAGLTMGPEGLAPLSVGQGNLLVDDQDIRFNGNANYDSFEITDYTKYNIKPCGVTGVFNTTFMGTLNIYGYDIDFRRFAFRQVCNKLDGKTFLDGSIEIPRPCDIVVSFLELDLFCSGDLGSGKVDSEPEDDWRFPDGEDNDGDGLTDEGNDVLAYWDVPIAINGMAFVPTGNDPDPCVNNENKELQLMTLDDVNGIDNTLTMKAIYAANGHIKDQNMTANVDTVYDEPMMSSEPGFDLRMQAAYLNQRNSYPGTNDGFINGTGLTDVPLFNDMNVHLQLENPDVDGLSLPNENYEIFVGKNDTANDADFSGIPDTYAENVTTYRDLLEDEEDKSEAGDPRARAKYSWPSAGIFDLNYAANYQRSNGEEKPQFLGVKQSRSLFNETFPIIQLESVPDFINPEKTKFSFGASADVARALNFVVDLISLEGIDNFLQNVLGIDIGFSLENILGGLINTEDFIKTVTGGDLSKLMGVVLDQTLDNGVLDNAFDDFSESVSLVQRIPQEISVRTAGVLDTFGNDLLNQASGGANPLVGVGGELETLFNDYAAFLTVPPNVLEDGFNGVGIATGIPYSIAQQTEIYQELENLRARLGQIETVLMTLFGEINAARNEVTSLQNELSDGLSDVTTFLNNINNNILTSGGPIGALTNLANNPIIQEVDGAKDKIQDILNIVRSIDIGLIASAVEAAASAAGADVDTSFVDDVESSIDDLVESLEEIVQVAEGLLEAAYTDMPDIFDEAKDLLDLVLNTSMLIDAQVGAVIGVVDSRLGIAGDVVGSVKQQLGALRTLLDIENITVPYPAFEAEYPTYNDLLDLGQDNLDVLGETISDNLDDVAIGTELDAFIASAPATFQGMMIDGLDSLLTLPVTETSDFIAGELSMILETAIETIPAPTVQDLKNIIKGAILNSPPIEALNENFYDLIAPLTQFIDDIVLQATMAINQLIGEGIKALAEGVSNLLDSVTSAIGTDFDVLSARIDGYAIVNTDELERLHIEAEFSYGSVPDPTSYNAALDVTAWNAENGKGACVGDGEGRIDVLISSHDVPINISGGQTKLREVALGFTLDNAIPIGFFGRAYLGGEVNFEAVAIKNLGLEVGVGAIENYLGATASGRFESYTLNIIAFYIGLTCDFGVLERLDPQIAEFIGPKSPLLGAYVRGAASIPIYNIGCFFTIGAGADIGIWYFHPDFGGLVGGSIYGKLACLASIRGGALAIFASVGGEGFFQGTGWGGAGIGFCSPEDWISVSHVRNDDWCLTGDATFGAEYKNGWDIIGPDVNCCD